MAKLSLDSKAFKSLISAVTKFPGIGGIAGADMISLSVSKGHLAASMLGVVLARARVQCNGEIPPVALDNILLTSFASICSEGNTVTIKSDTDIVIRTNGREITAPISPAVDHKMTAIRDLEDVTKLEIDEETASNLKYLASLAFTNSSRAELSCVMLTPDALMACSQQCIGVLQHVSAGSPSIAIPLPIAQNAYKGDIIWAGKKETILKSGIGVYAIPSSIKAQAEFPVKAIKDMQKLAANKVLTCKGDELKSSIADADRCLSSISRTEVILVLQSGNGKLEIRSENGGAKFRSNVPAETMDVESTVRVPLNEILGVSAFITNKPVNVSVGKKNGEVVLVTGKNWFLFPPWIAK